MITQAEALLAAVEAALPRWVATRVAQKANRDDIDTSAAERAALDDVLPRLKALLTADFADQPTNPLAVLRSAVVYPTALLRKIGAPPVARDEFAELMFPEDVYDLVPAAFADFGPEVHEAGIAWGAAKAFAHLHRPR